MTMGTGPLLIALLGFLVIAAILLRAGLERIAVPALVGYLALGFVVRLAGGAWGLPEEAPVVLEFMGRLGIIVLLFRVGLESEVDELRQQLGRAGPIWIISVLVSGLLGYGAARWLLGLALLPSMFAGVALTATSVGVSLGIWRSAGALESETGALLVDTVELDDFSGVALMALLLGVAPVVQAGGADMAGAVGRAAGLVLLKAVFFLGVCFLFARYLEGPLTRTLDRFFGEPRRILVVLGVGLLIASLAELLGFSFAIGAFFAGLAFSRDPESVRLDASFEELYALLAPFFFISLGFAIRPDLLGGALSTAGILLAAAVAGKIIGTALPAAPAVGWAGGLALGLSVVPRAEITMVIMERGLALGEWAVPTQLFNAAILVTLATCTLFPIVTRWFLDTRPELADEAA